MDAQTRFTSFCPNQCRSTFSSLLTELDAPVETQRLLVPEAPEGTPRAGDRGHPGGSMDLSGWILGVIANASRKKDAENRTHRRDAPHSAPIGSELKLILRIVFETGVQEKLSQPDDCPV